MENVKQVLKKIEKDDINPIISKIKNLMEFYDEIEFDGKDISKDVKLKIKKDLQDMLSQY